MSPARIVLASVALLAVSALVPAGPAGREDVGDALVFTHPTRLKPADVLRDGEDGKRIEIPAESVLIWVDRMPTARFDHPTEYVLISAAGTEVVKGDRWPVLNGEALFRDGEPMKAEFPIPVRRVPRTL